MPPFCVRTKVRMESLTQQNPHWLWYCVVLMLVCVLSGCTHLPVEPTRVTVTVTPDSLKSGHVHGEIAMIVAVRNDSKETLRFPVDGVSGPPFALNWVYYKILKTSPAGFVEDVDRVPLGDGVVSLATLSVGPGDASTLLTFFENSINADCSQRFVVELQDMSGDVFRSQSFRSCGP